MLRSIRHSLSSRVYACSYLPFMSHAPKTGFSVAPERKHNHWCFLKHWGTVKPDSALPRLCLRFRRLLSAAARRPPGRALSLACCGVEKPQRRLPSSTCSQECPLQETILILFCLLLLLRLPGAWVLCCQGMSLVEASCLWTWKEGHSCDPRSECVKHELHRCSHYT